MSKNRTRNNRITFYLDDSEKEKLEKNMRATGIKNREMFIRKMVRDGYILRVDMSELAILTRLVRNISNNINQIARRANECGCVYEDDVLALQTEVVRLKPLIAEAHREAIRICN